MNTGFLFTPQEKMSKFALWSSLGLRKKECMVAEAPPPPPRLINVANCHYGHFSSPEQKPVQSFSYVEIPLTLKP